MKKIFLVLAMAAMFAACNSNATEETTDSTMDSINNDTIEVVDSMAVDSTVAE